MHSRNFWYNLIEVARRTDIIIDGLTLPFILGAQKYINPNFGIDNNSICKLLTEITNSENDQKAVLKYYPGNQYIITLREAQFCKENLSGELVFKNKKGDNALYVTEEVTTFGNTLREICKALNEEYKKLMEKETFSWDDSVRSWHKFNDTEKNIITRAAG
jgi:hypothetical protein